MKTWMGKQGRWLLVMTAVLVGMAGCGLKLYPTEMLNSMALDQFQQMKQELPLSTNRAYVAQVERVGNRIAEAVGEDLPEANWEFVVFADDAVNAFAMPGGKVGVFEGLIKLVDRDDELAAVMGHEIAHVAEEHSNQRMSAELIRAGIGVGGAYALRDQDPEVQALALAAYGASTQVFFSLPYSRQHEREADAIGLIYAARAGYDPAAAIRFWQKMKAASGGNAPPQFLSTHPSHEDRIERLQALMPEAMEIYEANRR